MNNTPPDKEISLLELLKTRPDAPQRDLAEAIGLSLGMTNLLLKQLVGRGWMLMRKANARNVQYVLTPEGMAELTKRSSRYLKKTIRSVADCRVQLEGLVVQVKRDGFPGLALVGNSELDFVLEFLCGKHGLGYAAGLREGWFVVHGENESAGPNVMDFMDAKLVPEAVG